MNQQDNNYNWWLDPKNKEEVERLSWWNKPENQHTLQLPVSMVNDGKYVVMASNDTTDQLLGPHLHVCCQAKSQEEAERKFFQMLKLHVDYLEECRLNYQRFIPFSKGDWSHTGGKWFTILGFHFYFRYGKQNKGGVFIPFTYLNLSISNHWSHYKKYKNEKNSARNH